jgi:hypothetical protein
MRFEISKWEGWFDIRYIPFLSVGEQHLVIEANHCNDTGCYSHQVQDEGFK